MATGGDVIVNVEGELSFNTVNSLSEKNHILIEQHQKITFDLSQVTFSDNAGVALLVVFASYAKKLGKEVLFVNLPRQLLVLIEAGGIRDMLPIV